MLYNLRETFLHLGDAHWLTFAIFGVGFLFLLLWPKITSKVPAAIPLTVIGVLCGYLGTTQ